MTAARMIRRIAVDEGQWDGMSLHNYDRISRAFDVIAAPLEGRARRLGTALLDVRPGERVVDIGAGTGRSLARLAAAARPGGLVCGLDRSAGMLALARRRLSSLGTLAHLQLGDGRSLPYRNATFDGALLSFTLELFDPPDLARVLAEVKRVLKPRGRVVVVSLSRSRAGPMVFAYNWLHRHLPDWIDCRPIDVAAWLTAGGLRPVRTVEMRLWRLPVAAVLAMSEAA